MTHPRESPEDTGPVESETFVHKSTQICAPVFPTLVCVRQKQKVLEDLDQGAQLPVLLRPPQPHQELLQPLLQFLPVDHLLG